MNIDLAKNYFSKLLNSRVDENTVINLTSGQSVRAHAWLKANNFNTDDVNIRSSFTILQMMGMPQSPLRPQLPQVEISSNLEPSTGMRVPIGVDIQSIRELFPFGMPDDPKSDPELLSMFTIKELSYSQSKPNPLQTLAGIFAAKEAILKCCNKEIGLANLEILPDLWGRPSIKGYSISISHSVDYAIAIAMSNFKLDLDSINKDERIYNDANPSIKHQNSIWDKKLLYYLIFGLILILFLIKTIGSIQ